MDDTVTAQLRSTTHTYSSMTRSAHLSRLRLFQRHLRSLGWVWVWVWIGFTLLVTRSSPSRHPPFTQYPSPSRSLVRDGQTSPHRPRLVVSNKTHTTVRFNGRVPARALLMPGSRALRVGQQVALGRPWPWRVQSQSSSCLLSRGNLSPRRLWGSIVSRRFLRAERAKARALKCL